VTPQSPFAVANYFIRRASEDGGKLTPMKLLKLVYIAHGWHLGLLKTPLISEPAQAWKYGPVIPSLYRYYKTYGNGHIPMEGAHPEHAIPDDSVLTLLERVWAVYSKFNGGQLSTLTHAENTPWSKTYKPSERNLEIPNRVIQEHYEEKVRAQAAHG
jgi:uncharacterized phage-associated protein